MNKSSPESPAKEQPGELKGPKCGAIWTEFMKWYDGEHRPPPPERP